MTHRSICAALVAAFVSAWVSPTAGADSGVADDCQYVPTTASATVNPPVDISQVSVHEAIARADVHQIIAPDCRPQCVGRVFCISDFPEYKGKSLKDIPAKDRIAKGKLINCDPIPTDSATGPMCPFPDECRATAMKELFRLAKSVKPSVIGPDHHDIKDDQGKTLQSLRVKYGLVRDSADKEIPLYAFPSPNGEPSDTCHVCASPVTIATSAFSYVTCSTAPGLSGKPQDACGNANACADDHASDPTARSVLAVSKFGHIVPGSAPVKSIKAGTAKPPTASEGDFPF